MLRIKKNSKKQSRLYDLFKAFDYIESSRKNRVFFFSEKTCSKLPSNINTMDHRPWKVKSYNFFYWKIIEKIKIFLIIHIFH